MKTFLVLGLLIGSTLLCLGADNGIQGALDQAISLEREFKEAKTHYMQNIQGEGEIDTHLEGQYNHTYIASYKALKGLQTVEKELTSEQHKLFTHLKKSFNTPQNVILQLASIPETRDLVKGCFQGTDQSEDVLVALCMVPILGDERKKQKIDKFFVRYEQVKRLKIECREIDQLYEDVMRKGILIESQEEENIQYGNDEECCMIF